MKMIRNIFWVFALLALPLADAGGAQPISPQRAVVSGRNDVVYLAPATEPYEALPLGNGRLGVMMRNQGGITWLFNHGSFFANAAQDNDLLSSGEVTLALPENWQRCLVEQRLGLHDATLVTRYQTGGDTHTVTSWMAKARLMSVSTTIPRVTSRRKSTTSTKSSSTSPAAAFASGTIRTRRAPRPLPRPPTRIACS